MYSFSFLLWVPILLSGPSGGDTWGPSDLSHPFLSCLRGSRGLPRTFAAVPCCRGSAWLCFWEEGLGWAGASASSSPEEPARSPGGWGQPAGWPSGRPLPFPGPLCPHLDLGSEMERCVPGSRALSLLATQGSPRALILTIGLPIPHLVSLESASTRSASLVSWPRPSGHVWISLSAFASCTVLKLYVHFLLASKTAPADGMY